MLVREGKTRETKWLTEGVQHNRALNTEEFHGSMSLGGISFL